MKKLSLGVVLATILAASSAFAAQPAPATPPAGGGAAAGAGAAATAPGAQAGALTLVAADVTKLRDWITSQKTASVAPPSGFNVAVGQTLPASITLNPIPASVGVTAVGMNQYAVIDNKIILVDPMSRRIVYVFA
jgi:hypothetical protein